MVSDRFVFTVYRFYLTQLAEREGRYFKIPKAFKTLEDRNDFSSFCVLAGKLQTNGITEHAALATFMECASTCMPHFYIINILTEFDTLLLNFKAFKRIEVTRVDRIKKAFDSLKEYAILNNMKSMDEFKKGEPPILLKLWKGGHIDEATLVFLLDFESLKKKTWYIAYCGNLAGKVSKIKKDINSDVYIASTLEGELLKLKTVFI
jgi:hypothetical protein